MATDPTLPDGPRSEPPGERGLAREEVDDFLGGPGVVSTPGMWKGWAKGTALGAAIGALAGAAVGAVAAALADSDRLVWFFAAFLGVTVAGAVVGFVLGGAFGTLRYDQGGRRAEDDDGGPIVRPSDGRARPV
jgi:hypothetical protein